MNEYLIDKLGEIGCTSVAKAQICVHVYVELTEVKKYWNVKFCHDKTTDTTYITAQKNRNSERIIFLPIPVAESLSFNDMKKCFNLRQCNESIYLAIVDPDSTSVYYQISDGIAPPAQPLAVRLQARDRRQYNDSVLRRNTKIMEEAALCSLTIDLTAKTTGSLGMDYSDESE